MSAWRLRTPSICQSQSEHVVTCLRAAAAYRTVVVRTVRVSVCQFIGENYGFMDLLEEMPSDEGQEGAESRGRADGVTNFILLLITSNSAKLIVSQISHFL